jgi:hypothetical protein
MSVGNLINNICDVIGTKKMINDEKCFLELFIYRYLYHELKHIFIQHDKNKPWHNQTLFTEEEQSMIDGVLIQKLTNDLISSGEYDLHALATYTGYPEDAIFDIATGLNNNPTVKIANRIIDLHATSRKQLYTALIKKIMLKYITKDS